MLRSMPPGDEDRLAETLVGLMDKTPEDSRIKQRIVSTIGSEGYGTFTIMADANASELSIMRALRKYRPTLSRHTVHEWMTKYSEVVQ